MACFSCVRCTLRHKMKIKVQISVAVVVSIGFLATVSIVVFLWARFHEWGFRRELPWSAKDVHERYDSDVLLPDYSYNLKAKITQGEFRLYVTKFGLTPHTSTRQYSESPDPILNWQSATNSWWDPSDSMQNTFVWQGGTTWTFAKYERGHLYLESVCR